MKFKRTVYIPLVFAVLGLLLGSALFWQIFFFSVFLIALGYAWIVFSFRGIELQTRNLPETIVAGEWFEEDILIRNSSIFPRFGISINQHTGITIDTETWTDPLKKESTETWKTRVVCRRRGKYTLGMFDVSIADPFGFITMTRSLGTPKELIVYPNTIDLPLFQPEYSAGPAFYSRQRLMTRTSATISRVREYAEGDTLNHIHWPSTAHKGSLMVKVFETEPIKHYAGNVWMFLDMEQSIHAGSDEQSTAESGIVITASLICKYLNMDKNTGLVVSDERLHLFTPSRGEDHLTGLMKAMAVLKPEGKTSIESVISGETQHIEPNSTVIIVTTTNGHINTELLSEIKNRDCMVILIMIDASTYSPPGKGTIAAKPFTAAGIQVYTPGKDQDINRALDSHRLSGTLFSVEA